MQGYRYISNAILNGETRDSYFQLAKKVFKLDFYPWFNSGFCGDRFIPYALYDGDTAVSSVGVSISEMKWENQIKTYVQISTVMTDPDYRGKGLSKCLLDLVLAEWKDKSDFIYLYANDSVLDFYPKFGFVKAVEHRYSMPVSRKPGDFRKLDLSNSDDVSLLAEKYKASNPFSALTVENGIGLLMFHCITFLHDNIYYIEQFDAVVIANHKNNELFCYDIFAGTNCGIRDIMDVLAAEDTKSVTLGFTPTCAESYAIEQSNEKSTTLFALSSNENLLQSHKITLPFLSRA